MPVVFELYDQEGELRKYMELKVYPQPGDLVKIDNINKSQNDIFRLNVSSTVSLNKAYRVISVHNVTSIIIMNNNNDICHLRPKEYKVIKEVTDDELLNIKYRNDALEALMRSIRKQKSTSD